MAGGTVFTTIFALIAVYSQPVGEEKNPLLALWDGRAREISFLGDRFDVKMYFYVVGGTMLSLNALSGAAYHYERFGADFNPGVFLYAAFFTFYVLDYFIFERVQLYTYDLIHENVGFNCSGGPRGLRVDVHPPLWGMAAYPARILAGWKNFRLIGTPAPVPARVGIGRGANLQKYTFKRWRRAQVSGYRAGIHPGRRPQDPVQRSVGVARHFNYMGEVPRPSMPWCSATHESLGLDLLRLHRLVLHCRQRYDDAYCARNTAPRSGRSIRSG